METGFRPLPEITAEQQIAYHCTALESGLGEGACHVIATEPDGQVHHTERACLRERKMEEELEYFLEQYPGAEFTMGANARDVGDESRLAALQAAWVELPRRGAADLAAVWRTCTDAGLAKPHYAVRSPSGLSLVWLLDPVPADDEMLRRWRAVQESLRLALAPLSPAVADDPWGTVRLTMETYARSTGAGADSRLYVVDELSASDRYEWYALRYDLHRLARQLHRAPQEPPVLGPRPFRRFTVETLVQARIDDLLRLTGIRASQEGIQAQFLFIYLTLLRAQGHVAEEIRVRATDFADRLRPPLPPEEVSQEIEGYLDRCLRKQEPRNRRWSNRKLVEMLHITAEEQQQMATIKVTEVDDQAPRPPRPKGTFRRGAAARRARAIEMLSQGQSTAAVAAELGLSRRRVQQFWQERHQTSA